MTVTVASAWARGSRQNRNRTEISTKLKLALSTRHHRSTAHKLHPSNLTNERLSSFPLPPTLSLSLSALATKSSKAPRDYLKTSLCSLCSAQPSVHPCGYGGWKRGDGAVVRIAGQRGRGRGGRMKDTHTHTHVLSFPLFGHFQLLIAAVKQQESSSAINVRESFSRPLLRAVDNLATVALWIRPAVSQNFQNRAEGEMVLEVSGKLSHFLREETRGSHGNIRPDKRARCQLSPLRHHLRFF